MVSSIILSQSAPPVSPEDLHRIIDALHSAQVFDIAVVHDGGDRDLAHGLESLPVKPVTTTKQHEIARLAVGITACEQKELHGVVVLRSDQHLTSHALLVDLLHQFWVAHTGIVRSRMQGNHDVCIIADTLFGEIQGSSDGESLEAFVARHAGQTRDVPFDELGTMIRREQSVAGQSSDFEVE